MANPSNRGAFGAYLRTLRESQGLTLGAVLIRLRALGVATKKSTLSRYETGQREKLDPLALWGLAKVYRRPCGDLLNELASRTSAPAEHVPESRLTEAEEREARLLALFRRAPIGLQRDFLEWIEFKVGKEGKQPQQRAAAGRKSRPRQD